LNRILVAFLASLACVALTANASELFVEPATLASSADRLDSFLGLGEEPEDKDAAPASDAALDVNGKPVFNGTQKVGQDAGEIETLPDPPKENKTKAEPRMVAVKFYGHKHRKPKNIPDELNFTKPTNYEDRKAFRKAKYVMKDVMKDFPDKYGMVELSNHARCVDSDPYMPDWKNPIGLKNPTVLRKAARKIAENAYEFDSSENLQDSTNMIMDTAIHTDDSAPSKHTTHHIFAESENHHELSDEQVQTVVSLDKGLNNMAKLIKLNASQEASENLQRMNNTMAAQEATEEKEDSDKPDDEDE